MRARRRFSDAMPDGRGRDNRRVRARGRAVPDPLDKALHEQVAVR